MSGGFDPDKFHECEDFSLRLPAITDRLRVSEYLKTLGFVVEEDGDFAYLPRTVDDAPWQASDVTQVAFFLGHKPSYAPNPIDRLNFLYLLATLPEESIPIFTSVIQSCVAEFRGVLTHRLRVVDSTIVADILQGYVAELRGELADDPGSDFVARMLYEFRPRA